MTQMHRKPPIQGAIASALGWHHPKTNELLVSIRGLPINGNAETVKKDEELETDPPQALAVTAPTPPDEDDGDDAGESDPAAAFSVTTVEDGVAISIVKPFNHKSTTWKVNGVAVETKGNDITVPAGSVVVANSAKGEFTVTV